jgi:DNA-binding response OmpR family regulator
LSAAAHAILLQADEILVKPMDIKALVDVIRQRLASGPSSSRTIRDCRFHHRALDPEHHWRVV